MKFWKAHGKQTAHHLIEIGLAAQGCDCPRHRSQPTSQGSGGIKEKLRFAGGSSVPLDCERLRRRRRPGLNCPQLNHKRGEPAEAYGRNAARGYPFLAQSVRLPIPVVCEVRIVDVARFDALGVDSERARRFSHHLFVTQSGPPPTQSSHATMTRCRVAVSWTSAARGQL